MRYGIYIFVLCLSILAWASVGIKPASALYYDCNCNQFNNQFNQYYNPYGYGSFVPQNQYGPYYGNPYGWNTYGNYGYYSNYNYYGWSLGAMLFGGGSYRNPYVWY